MAGSRRARRRRRGGQAAPGKAAGRWALRGLIVVGVVAVLGVLGGYFWLQNYLRSERFRVLVNTRVSETLEAESAFNKFNWDGMELRAPEFRARGEKMIRRIDLEGLETEIKFAPLLSRKVKTHEIRARRLEVEVDVTKDGPAMEAGGKETFTFSGVRVEELVGMVDFGSTALKWDGIKATMTPGYTKGSYNATLTRGRLLTPLALFPELRLQEAGLTYGDGALFLKRGDWKVFESGRLETDGEIDFGRGRYYINGNLTRVQCEEVLPDDWQKRLRGELTSQFKVKGAGKEAPVISGALQLARGHLTALPVLDRIAAYTGTERFRRLILRKANLTFRQEGERLELTDIEIASEGLLRIEGKLTIDHGKLEGEFQLGLTPGTLARIPGAAERVFLSGRDGMHWAPVRITGTTALPREDLSERLIAAGFEWMYEMVDGQLVLKESGKVAGAMAKGLWDTAGEAGKIGIGIIEQGTDLLRNGKLPIPVDPIREGVGGVLDGILGTPRRPAEDDPLPVPKTPPERPERPEGNLLDDLGEKVKGESDPDQKPGEKANEGGEEEKEKSIDEKVRKLIEGELGVE